MAADELAEEVARGGGTGEDDLIREVPLQIGGEAVGRVVAALAIFFEALHHDPIEIAAQGSGQLRALGVAALRGGREFVAVERFHARRRARRIDLADDPPDFIQARAGHRRRVDRRAAGEQFVEQHAEAVDVAARVDVERGKFRLLGTHVERRPDHLLELREERPIREPPLRRLRHAEVDDLPKPLLASTSRRNPGEYHGRRLLYFFGLARIDAMRRAMYSWSFGAFAPASSEAARAWSDGITGSSPYQIIRVRFGSV